MVSTFMGGLLWIMGSTGYGIISSEPWMYTVHMGIAMLLANGLMWINVYVVEKYGVRDYNEEGTIMLLGVPTAYLFTISLFLPVKTIWVLIRMLF